MLHFFFGIGSIIGPLIAKPFLLLTDKDSDFSPELLQYVPLNGTEPSVSPSPFPPEAVRIQYTYAIVSVYTLIVTSIFAGIYFKRPENEPHPSKAITDPTKETPYNPRARLLVIVMATVFLHFYFALEIVFGCFLTAYVVKSDLHMDKAQGAFLSSVFWATFTFFRIPSIFIIKLIGFTKSITSNLTLMVAGAAVLLSLGGHSYWAVWLGIILMGLGISSIFATLLGYLETFFPITGNIASTFMVSGCVGEFIWPLVVGKYIVQAPSVFLLATGVCTVCCCVFFASLVYICENHVLKKKESDLSIKRF